MKRRQTGMRKTVALRALRRLAAPLVLALLVVAVYAQVRHHGFILFDDPDYVTENPRVRSGLRPETLWWAMTTFTAGNWHPITMGSHLLDIELFGMDAGLHHATSVVLHWLNTVLLYLVLTRMTGAGLPAAAVAAWFAVHPIHVESVAWIAERKDVLSGLFWMLCLLCYYRYTSRPGRRTYVLLMVTFALGLMAKPTLVTLPVVLLLLDQWPLARWDGKTERRPNGETPDAIASSPRDRTRPGRSLTAGIREKLPLLLLSAASAAMTWVAQNSAGAVASFAAFPLDERLANAVHSYCRYLQLAVWPTDLAVFYPHPGRLPLVQTNLEGAALITLCLAALVLGRRHRFVAVGWLWFLITLLPTIGLVQVGAQAMADRYAYIPFVGLYILAAWSLWATTAGRFRRGAFAVVVAAAATAALAVAARQQVSLWKSDIELFSHAVRTAPGNYRMLNNLGLAYAANGEPDRAVSCYQRALAIEPRFSDARLNLGNAYVQQEKFESALSQFENLLLREPEHRHARFNIAAALVKAGKTEAAAESLRQLLQKAPDFAEAHNLMGNIERGRNRFRQAAVHYRRAVESDPFFTEGRYHLAVVLEKLGRSEEAIRLYRRTVTLDPGFVEAHNNLGRLLTRQGRLDEALMHYAAAIRSRPLFAQAHFNTAGILMNQGRPSEAVRWYERAVWIDGKNAVYRKGLAEALMRLGRYDQAATHFHEIVKQNPRSAPDLANLGNALAESGARDSALQQYQAALQLQPDNPRVLNDMGVLLVRMGKPGEGLRHLEKALRLRPGDARILRNLETAKKAYAKELSSPVSEP